MKKGKKGNGAMMKKILFITALCLAFNACSDYLFKDRQELIVVNKIPRGSFAGEELSPELRNIGWYDIGLSRNGKEPVEYIWRAENDEFGHYIINTIIGERGTIYLCDWAKQRKIKLPRPNAENPPTIGAIGEVYWKKQK